MGLGLYLHVPYCRALCHYCDFAKTANFDAAGAARYLARLEEHLGVWLDSPWMPPAGRFTSVFLGGGTPSLFTREYAPLFRRLAPRLAAGCEVSLEANPDDVTDDALAAWRDLGVTRLSLGVQTFDAGGLAFLRRVHDAAQAERAVARAAAVFPNVNVDLIYGWQGQTDAGWRTDLARALDAGAAHLSLYALTFEGQTPLARAARRGRLAPEADEALADRYEAACAALAAAGFEHEEVSNWARPGASCAHNWLYWQDEAYVGIGAGAHGYAPESDGPGVRYAYARSDRTFERGVSASAAAAAASTADPSAIASALGADVEARTREDWLLEYVGTSLRSARGMDVAHAERKAQRRFSPTPVVAEALARGILRRDGARLLLQRAEWFRETAWSVEVALAFVL